MGTYTPTTRQFISALGHSGMRTADSPFFKWKPPAPANNLLATSMATKAATRNYSRSTYRRKSKKYRRRNKKRTKATGFPPSITRRVVTSYNFGLDPGVAGAITTQVINLNSAFDPAGTLSATQQPLGMDQYEALYNKYCVVGWKITVEAALLENSYPCVVGFTPTTNSTTLTSANHYRELPGTVSRLATPDVDKLYFKAKGSVKKWIVPKGGKLLSTDEGSAAIGSNPARMLYGHFFIQCLDSAQDAGVARLIVKQEQIVVFYDRKNPSRSTQ